MFSEFKMQLIFCKCFWLDLFIYEILPMKKIFLLLLFFFLFSCEKKEPAFSEEMIKELTDRGKIKGDSEPLPPPPPIIFSDVYLRTDSDEIVLLDEIELFSFYNKYYSKQFKSFTDFLNAFLNDGTLINIGELINSKYLKRFKLNLKIEKEYSDLGFDEFFKKYSKPLLKDLIINKSNIKEGEYLSVTYLLYRNGYDISSDCYLGVDYIRKRKVSSFKYFYK